MPRAGCELTRVGIDIGGTSVKMAAAHGGGWRVAISERYAMPDRAALQSALASAWSKLGAETPESDVGLCVPGVPASDGNSIEIAVNLPGLVGWDLTEMVRETVGGGTCSVVRTSDADAALRDWQAEAGATGRSLGIVIGTGVGLSVLDGDRPAAWTDGGAGHLGQIDVTVGDPSSAPIGPDGGRGGLEGYVGARAVAAAGGMERAFAPGAPGLEALARAVRVCHAIYRPDAVVLLGGIGIRLAGSEALESAIRRELTSLAKSGWRLAFGVDDFHAARGAARAAARLSDA